MAKQRRLPNTRQQTLGLDDEAVVERAEPAGEAVRFQDPDPHDIMVGGTRLDAYLEQASLGWVVRLRALLRTVDVSALEQNYQAGGHFIPAYYKPSIIANEHRFILAQTLHPSNETVVIPDLVAQAERTLEHPVPTLSLDAGYFCLTVIVFCLHNDIDLLCPSGRLDTTGNPDRARSNRRFTKADFRYDETRDAYVCPADRLLVRRSPQSNFGGRRTHVFAARTSD